MPTLKPEKAERIREYARKWENYWQENILHYHEMTNFIMGTQWQDDEEKLFTDLRKIPLSVNKLAPQMNHLLGEQRQNTPNLQIDPADEVPEQTAEIRAALIKEISLDSHAKVVYQTAFEQACCGGFSGFRLYTKYVNDKTFDQEIGIASFKDPTKCFWSLDAESPCKVDGLYAGYKTNLSRKKFKQKYGSKIEKNIGSNTTDVMTPNEITLSFSDENFITVIDIYERKSKMETLYELSNGRSIDSDELKDMQRMEIDGKEMLLDETGMVVTIERTRKYPKYHIEHSIWAGDYELEVNKDFPSKQLPIIFVDQHSYFDKKGKQITRSFFKDAKDSQRFLNYLRTQSAYLIMISRYDQFMLSKENARSPDTEAIWRNPGEELGGLIYDESPNGNKPEQLRSPELSQSLMAQYETAARDIQATTGMYDTQMGEQGNEISGDAIDARTERGNFNTYIPTDSLNRSIAVSGEITDEMIPKVYDTERKMRLNLKDSVNKAVSINRPIDPYGGGIENDMTQGEFKIRLIPGASIESQKTEGLQSMDMILSKAPQLFNLIGDLYAENLPLANSLEIRNRLRTIVDPAVIQAGKTGQPLPPKPPQQDPMIAIKQQELQFKMQNAQLIAQGKMKDLQFKEQQLMMDSHNAGVNYASELQKLEAEKQELSAKLVSEERMYQAEMARIAVDAHKGHASNITKILTHQPNQQFKDEIIPDDNSSNGNT